MPVTSVEVAQAKNWPRRQGSQYPQYPPFHPTPTRCPGVHPATPAPTASTNPTTSCPGTRGYVMPGNVPSLVSESLWQMPHACTLIRNVPARGCGTARSTISNGPFARETCTARIVAMNRLRDESPFLNRATRLNDSRSRRSAKPRANDDAAPNDLIPPIHEAASVDKPRGGNGRVFLRPQSQPVQ